MIALASALRTWLARLLGTSSARSSGLLPQRPHPHPPPPALDLPQSIEGPADVADALERIRAQWADKPWPNPIRVEGAGLVREVRCVHDLDDLIADLRAAVDESEASP